MASEGREARARLGAQHGEIPAAGRGYDGSRGRGYDGSRGRGAAGLFCAGRRGRGLVRSAASYLRRSAGMTDPGGAGRRGCFVWAWAAVVRAGGGFWAYYSGAGLRGLARRA